MINAIHTDTRVFAHLADCLEQENHKHAEDQIEVDLRLPCDGREKLRLEETIPFRRAEDCVRSKK